jgi:hypothetical protein
MERTSAAASPFAQIPCLKGANGTSCCDVSGRRLGRPVVYGIALQSVMNHVRIVWLPYCFVDVVILSRCFPHNNGHLWRRATRALVFHMDR